MPHGGKRQRGCRWCCRFAVALAAISCVATATAQTNLETNSGIRFNFSPPGAPNLALGGAFIGLADDATAAYTNPAGLIKLSRPEVTTEVRRWEYTHLFTDRGLVDNQENRDELAVEGGLERAEALGLEGVGLIDGETRDTVPALSFFSYVYPRERWTLALFRHELVNFEAHFSTFGFYQRFSVLGSVTGIPGTAGVTDGRLASLRNEMRLRISNYGLAGAYRLGAGFSLGLALSYYDFGLDTRADRYLPPFEEAPSFSDASRVNSQVQKGEDDAWSGTAGLRWESPRGRVSLGAVFRRGPTFRFETLNRDEQDDGFDFDPIRRAGRFRVPDVWGIGLGWRPIDALRVAVDYDHIEYSALSRDLVDVFGLDTLFPRPDLGLPAVDPELDKFSIADADELHVGIEYFFLDNRSLARTPFSILVGAWHDPDHSLVFEGRNEGFAAIFRPRPDQTHFSIGVGFSASNLQAYVAYDYSKRTRVLSLSVVRRFRVANGGGRR